jgi:hypothetical protein
VIDDGRLVGLLTRTDVLRTRKRQLELERRQEGAHLRHHHVDAPSDPSTPEPRQDPN